MIRRVREVTVMKADRSLVHLVYKPHKLGRHGQPGRWVKLVPLRESFGAQLAAPRFEIDWSSAKPLK